MPTINIKPINLRKYSAHSDKCLTTIDIVDPEDGNRIPWICTGAVDFNKYNQRGMEVTSIIDHFNRQYCTEDCATQTLFKIPLCRIEHINCFSGTNEFHGIIKQAPHNGFSASEFKMPDEKYLVHVNESEVCPGYWQSADQPCRAGCKHHMIKMPPNLEKSLWMDLAGMQVRIRIGPIVNADSINKWCNDTYGQQG